jgi:S-DNA-T family DNA segregation ATPase FtsK/SpoIIIE
MARSRQTMKPETALSAQVTQNLREAALYIFAALALILWFALFTYDSSDAALTQASGDSQVNNGIGHVGAIIADLLFYLFGKPAYLFTVMVFYSGWMIYRDQRVPEQRREPECERR